MLSTGLITTLKIQFTAPDLSDLARNLDLAEQSYSDRFQGGGSMNMDDTGIVKPISTVL